MSNEGLEDTAVESPGAAARQLAPGSSVGKYKLARELGAGGMGVVWAAHDPDLDRDVALKLLRRENADADLRTRLLREARAMARLRHPNVLTVYEVGSEGDRDYIAMQLVDGTSLDVWLTTRPARRDVMTALLAAGRGLAAAHDAGLVHRDFKPHNVLRSTIGEVLVTDFGLARGVADEGAAVELLAPSPGRRNDPVLDSTLTQTGAMIGTPAYMAPEQFEGATPDPRTDQFAYCVTAWQALSGERPYSGGSLDELRRAVTAGTRTAGGKLPGRIRRVLARGLDPDPKNRWPDMKALLHRLERTARAPSLWALGGGAMAIAIGIGILTMRAKPPAPAVAPAADACGLGDSAFDVAWSTRTRQALAARLANGGYTDAIPRWFDGLRTRWLGAYLEVCSKPADPQFHARLGCLLGARDSVTSLVDLMQQLSISDLGSFDVFGVAPQLGACTGTSPPTPPAMPTDHATRAKVAAIRLRAHELRDQQPEGLAAAEKQLEIDARAVQWPPLVGEVLYAASVAARRLQVWPLAEDLVSRAAFEAAASRDPATEAQARIDRYELSIDVAENPRDGLELERLAKEARAAIRGAGDDPVQNAALDVMQARVAVLQHDPDRALAAPVAARDTFLATGDSVRAAIAAVWTVDAYLQRDQQGDVEAARALIEQTRAKIPEGLSLRADNRITLAIAEVAWRRGDLAAFHKVGGEMGVIATGPGLLADDKVGGKVVGPDGKPVGDATVRSWRGELAGDGESTARGLTFQVSSDSDGAFGEAALPGAVIAEHGELRSQPMATSAAMIVKLRPTHRAHGNIVALEPIVKLPQGPQPSRIATPGVDGCIVVAVEGGEVWVDRAAAAPDGTFDVDRVPEGDWPLCATDGVRRVLAVGGVVHWPGVAPLDVIVRGAAASLTQVWVFRGTVQPRTRREAEVLAARAADVATDYVRPIGQGTATAAGRDLYQPGDLHVVIQGNAKGMVTVCVGRDDKPGDPVACNHHEMKIPTVNTITVTKTGEPAIAHVSAPGEAVVIVTGWPADDEPR